MMACVILLRMKPIAVQSYVTVALLLRKSFAVLAIMMFAVALGAKIARKIGRRVMAYEKESVHGESSQEEKPLYIAGIDFGMEETTVAIAIINTATTRVEFWLSSGADECPAN